MSYAPHNMASETNQIYRRIHGGPHTTNLMSGVDKFSKM